VKQNDIEDIIEDRFHGSACVCGAISTLQYPLLPEEDEYVQKCVLKRRMEFTAGRTAARMAMKKLDIAPTAIPRGEKNNPIWPWTLIGSISHCDNTCLCVIADKTKYSSIGVDIEELHRVQLELFPSIFSNDEITVLNKLQNKDLAFHATAGFSIKEAFYKFQYPITRQWLGFKDVEVVVSSDKISLEIVSKAKIKNILPKYDCFFYSRNNLVVTGVFACR